MIIGIKNHTSCFVRCDFLFFQKYTHNISKECLNTCIFTPICGIILLMEKLL